MKKIKDTLGGEFCLYKTIKVSKNMAHFEKYKNFIIMQTWG
jgi:hypothetical protein